MGRTHLKPLSSWFLSPSLVIAVVDGGGGGVIAVTVEPMIGVCGG